MNISKAVMVGLGLAAAAALAVAFLKSRPKPSDQLSVIPPTPNTSTSVGTPAYDLVLGVGGIAPLQLHPDTTGVSIAATNPP